MGSQVPGVAGTIASTDGEKMSGLAAAGAARGCEKANLAVEQSLCEIEIGPGTGSRLSWC